MCLSTDQVLHAGSNNHATFLLKESLGLLAMINASLHEGSTGIIDHLATAEDIFARRRRDEELLNGLKLDLHLQSCQKSCRRPSREISSSTWLAASSPVGLWAPPFDRDGAFARPVLHLCCLWSPGSYAAGPARPQRCLWLRRPQHFATSPEAVIRHQRHSADMD